MTEREALLRAVCENPDDDTPRLVFADWLEENGEAARAEFTRLQVQLAAMYREAAPGKEAVEKEVNRLWLRYGAEWRESLPHIQGVQWHDAFHRGFAEHVIVDSDKTLVTFAEEIFNSAPVRYLVVLHFGAVNGFGHLTYLGRLRTFTARNEKARASLIQRLIAFDNFGDSTLLCFHFGSRGNASYPELREKFGNRLHHPPAPLLAPPEV
ncbi:MAG TPA: TIGR02996 domain-containing protein [Gemmata sp.]|nr:TIGR02996 domain-containing protein [Gemmata sp.]